MRLKVVLVLPERRLWRWHATLIQALERRGEAVEVRLSAGPAYPLAMRAWLALERRLFGRADAAPIRRSELPSPVSAVGPGEVLVDLSGGRDRAAAGRRLSLRFDGASEEAALFSALQARRSCRLEVVDGEGRVLAASVGAVEVRDELARSLSYVHARLVAMILRALDGTVTPAVEPPEVLGSMKSGGLAGFALGASRRKLAARLSRGRSAQETWRIALRPARGQASDAPPQPGGFIVHQGPRDAFHADPFLFAHQGRAFLFVEAYPWAACKGVIACAELDTQGRPGAFETVLEAEHHLSYPQVFAHDGEVFMLPETASARRLELYRATDFPHGWERVTVMLEGQRIADATLVDHDGRWWLFASIASFGGASQDELFAWYGGSPFGPWTPHALNPLVSDVRAGRPAGRFVRRGGRLYRPAQDSEAGYGSGIAWCEVLELTPEHYREHVVARWRGADFGPFTGVHTFSEGAGFEAIDLKSRR